jgi:hypothetical protein
MEGEFSGIVLVAAFAVVAGLCGKLTARLCRIGSARGPAAKGEPQAADPTAGNCPS